MFADIGTHMPQEFDDQERCLAWFQNKQLGLKHSLRLLAKDKESMMIRTPITNDIIVVYGEQDEIEWLHLELIKAKAFVYKI